MTNRFPYPPVTKWSRFKLIVIFLVQCVLIFSTCMLAIHGTWKYKSWVLQTDQMLRWEIGLLSVTGSVNCDSPNQLPLYAICMSVFKNVFGKLTDIRRFLCDLPVLPLRIEEDLLADARSFSQSCPVMETIANYSLAAFILLILSAIFIAVGIGALMCVVYQRYAWKARVWYWIILLFTAFALLFQIIAVSVYATRISAPLRNLFDYTFAPDPSLSLIRNIGDGAFGPAVGITVALIFSLAVLLVFCAFSVPILQEGKALMRRPETPKRKAEAFWAYMPEVFQPNIFVAEIPEVTVPVNYATETTTLLVGSPGGGPTHVM